ncbi:MAG: DUF3617 family protein [Paracoccaceae bacterium]
MTIIAPAFLLPAQSVNGQTVDLDAGLWEYSVVLEVDPAGVVNQETETFCLSEAQSNLTTNDIINQISGGQCSSSNEVLLIGSGSADMTCVYPEDNAHGTGRLEARYTTTTYTLGATMRFTGPGGTSTARFTGQGRRLGDC